MRYAFYVSGKSGRLKKYLQKGKNIEKIALVVSEYPIENELKKILDDNNIFYINSEYEKLGECNLERNRAFSDFLLANLIAYKCDYCFSFGTHILSGKLLDVYRNRIINFHPSILPMFPGNKSIDKAVESRKCFLLGNSAHFIDEGVDSGPIILQSIIPINAFLQTRDYDIVLDLQLEMLNQIIMLLEEDRISVEGHVVNIKSADYSWNCIFPKVE